MAGSGFQGVAVYSSLQRCAKVQMQRSPRWAGFDGGSVGGPG